MTIWLLHKIAHGFVVIKAMGITESYWQRLLGTMSYECLITGKSAHKCTFHLSNMIVRNMMFIVLLFFF